MRYSGRAKLFMYIFSDVAAHLPIVQMSGFFALLCNRCFPLHNCINSFVNLGNVVH